MKRNGFGHVKCSTFYGSGAFGRHVGCGEAHMRIRIASLALLVLAVVMSSAGHAADPPEELPLGPPDSNHLVFTGKTLSEFRRMVTERGIADKQLALVFDPKSEDFESVVLNLTRQNPYTITSVKVSVTKP